MSPSVPSRWLFLLSMAVLIVSGALLARPGLDAWRRLSASEETLGRELDAATRLVAEVPAWRARADELARVLPAFPADQDMAAYWLSAVERIAARHGVRIMKRQVGEETRARGLRSLVLEFKEFEASEESLVRFLFDLTMEPAVRVRDFAVKPADGSRLLRGRFALSTLWRAGAPEAGTLAASTNATTPDFARYQVMCARKTFGTPPAPPPVAAIAPPVPPAGPGPSAPPPFVKTLRLCSIVVDEQGARVGVVNIQAKPVRTYRLRVGDTEDGIELVNCNAEQEAALLRKDGEEHWIYMEGASPEGARPAPGAAVSPPAGAAQPVTYKQQVQRRLALRERILEQRRAEEQAKELTPEETQKRLQEYQMELIRAGGEKGPALPIPLTKEMDDQLVSEGVLPPQEQK